MPRAGSPANTRRIAGLLCRSDRPASGHPPWDSVAKFQILYLEAPVRRVRGVPMALLENQQRRFHTPGFSGG